MRTSIRGLRFPAPLAAAVIVALAAISCGSGSSGLFTSTESSSSGAGAGGASTSATGSGGSGGEAASSTASSSGGGSTSSSTGSSTTSASSSSGGVDAGPLGPTITILHPGGGVDRKQNVSIYFHGTGVDPTDGMLSGNALVWTDSLEGKFGTGDPVNWAPTMLGAHTITLTGTDSLNYSATSTVTFNIIP
jgi:hypothetical protein